jgi:four helix bundle protein
MSTFRFLEFPVYVKSKELYKIILKLTDDLRNLYLKDQIRRAVLSIILNIAEGSAKKSDKDFARYIQISLGSVNEVYACLDLMHDNGDINSEKFNELKIVCEEITKQLGGFYKKLKS